MKSLIIRAVILIVRGGGDVAAATGIDDSQVQLDFWKKNNNYGTMDGEEPPIWKLKVFFLT